MAEKKEETKKEQKERKKYDNLGQKLDCVEWEKQQVEQWRQELKTRELAVAAREAAIFQRELEYRRLERCPLCGKRGRRDEARRQGGPGQEEAVANRTAAGVRAANATLERRNFPEVGPRTGEMIQRALVRGDERATGNINWRVETWEETYAAL